MPSTPKELELVRRCKAGDRDAQDALVRMHWRLVCKIAHRTAGHHWRVEVDDMAQVGALGLLHAAELYDPSLGVKFSTYATWWVRQRIQREEFRAQLVYAPARSLYPDQAERAAGTVSVAEVGMAELGLDFDVIDRWAGPGLEYDEREDLAAALGALRPRLAMLVSRHYFRGETFAAMGRRLGISKQRCRQLVARALRVMRKHIQKRRLVRTRVG